MSHREWSGEEAGEQMVEAIFDSFVARRWRGEHTVLVEKTPSHLLVADRILRQFPGSVMIEMLRDGRDTCVSKHEQWVSKGRAPATLEHDELDYLIKKWVTYASRGMELRADPELCDRMLLVRYEDLRSDPVPQIERVLAFTGLDDEPTRAAELADLTDFARYQTGPGRHRRKGVIGDWRNYFDAEAQQRFAALAGQTFLAAGYVF
jgi:hypothetical protein